MSGASSVFPGVSPSPDSIPPAEVDSTLEMPDIFRGYSLFIFSPRIRNILCDVLVYPVTEPAILILIIAQLVFLVVENSANLFPLQDEQLPRWGSAWVDWALLSIWVIFTVDILCRIIVSGLLLGDIANANSLRATGDRIRTVEQVQRLQLARAPFLRHSFNRMDFIALISFWISIALSVTGLESQYHIRIFRTIGCLRIFRLLALTNGTAAVLRTLKFLFPYLIKTWSIIAFFALLFSLAGVQAFHSSLKRHCVWLDPLDSANFSASYVNEFTFCSGYLDNETGLPLPWVASYNFEASEPLQPGFEVPNGYLCPRGSICMLKDNPYNGTLHFDNIFNGLEVGFVMISGTSFSKVMYDTINSDSLPATLFFGFGIVCLRVWLVNFLLVSYAIYFSHFNLVLEPRERSLEPENLSTKRLSAWEMQCKNMCARTFWCWILLITYDLVSQCFRGPSTRFDNWIDISGVVVTLLLDIEIILRIFAAPWRVFLRSPRNVVDCGLALSTTIIALLLLSAHLSKKASAGLTIFQILRAYRIILVIPTSGKLVQRIILQFSSGRLGSTILFVLLLTFLVSVLANQLFKGSIPVNSAEEPIQITFSSTLNSFYGIFQILSRARWTDILYNVTSYSQTFHEASIGAIFLTGWYILASWFVMPAFIPLINNAFQIHSRTKKTVQTAAFLQGKELVKPLARIGVDSAFPFPSLSKRRDSPEYTATGVVMLEEDTLREFLAGLEDESEDSSENALSIPNPSSENEQPSGILEKCKAVFGSWEDNPFHSDLTAENPLEMARHSISVAAARNAAEEEYMARHPTYNDALYIFRPRNSIRRLCQQLVSPGPVKRRFHGVEPNRIAQFAFSAVVFAAVVATTVITCIAAPLYQRQYFEIFGYSLETWFIWTDIMFTVMFTFEAFIRSVADGFFWTPNAYYRTFWGSIDGAILISMWATVVTTIVTEGAVPRSMAVFKSLRAFRLLTVSDSARYTLFSLMCTGFSRIIVASILSISILVPSAIYGLNLFNGQLVACNDKSSAISNLRDCFGEWHSTPYSSAWPLLAPRVASNPYFNFDTFADALLTTFTIITQSGWVDVSFAVQAITGPGLQPRPLHSQGFGLFLVVFNFVATNFILIVFLATFIRSYTRATGTAYLFDDQMAWLELRRKLYAVAPLQRPCNRQHYIRRRCQTLNKNSSWQNCLTCLLVAQLILLSTQFYPEPSWWTRTRNYIFLAFSMAYLIDICTQIVGLGLAFFLGNIWLLLSFCTISGMFLSSLLVIRMPTGQWAQAEQAHNFFLIAIPLHLIPRVKVLKESFCYAALTLPAIGNLVAVWLVFLIAYAIAMVQMFGLTRFGPTDDVLINFQTIPHASLLLFRLSLGEDWSEIMASFATISPPFCVAETSPFDSDCGSMVWARILFISWNILSMFLFMNMLVALIYEHFAYHFRSEIAELQLSDEDTQRFQGAWQTVDAEGTGYIGEADIYKLVGRLSGVFYMRIHPPRDSVTQILSDLGPSVRPHGKTLERDMGGFPGVNLHALNNRLCLLDIADTRKRRHQLDMFVLEAKLLANPEGQIAMGSILELLVHYKLVDHSRMYLRLEEFAFRKARIRRAEKILAHQVVVSYLETVYFSREFKKRIAQQQLVQRKDVQPTLWFDEMSDTIKETSTDANDMDTSKEFKTGGLRLPVSSGGTHDPIIPSMPESKSQDSKRPSLIISREGVEPNQNNGFSKGPDLPTGMRRPRAVIDSFIWVEEIESSKTTRFGES